MVRDSCLDPKSALPRKIDRKLWVGFWGVRWRVGFLGMRLRVGFLGMSLWVGGSESASL